MRLYGIREADLLDAIQSPDLRSQERRRTVALKRFPHRFAGYPLKVVYREEEGEILIVTAYPFKKAYWR
jgi:hypothetical protein